MTSSFVPVSSADERSSERKMIKKCFDCRESMKHTSFKIQSKELNGVSGVGRSNICLSCSKTKYPPRISYSELQEKVLNLYDIVEELESRIEELENQ